jgi:hypothetical protein
MSSNVHALELGKAFKRVDTGLPAEADVEEAFRTIIRWGRRRSRASWAARHPRSPRAVLSRIFRRL